MNARLSQRKEDGNLGESLACRYLEGRGYEIVDRNYSRKCGEIDIIVRDLANVLRFIEVKSKNTTISGFMGNNVTPETDSAGFRPEDNVNDFKLKKLARAIQLYLVEKRVSPETRWAFDVVVVYMDKVTKRSYIRHLEDVGL